MPYGFYKVFTTGDLEAVVAYLRSVPAVSNKVQAPVYKATLHVEVPPGADKRMPEADLRDPVKHGFICHDRPLHGVPHAQGKRPFGFCEWPWQGRSDVLRPLGRMGLPNITSHPEKGIGAWSDGEIKRAITQGIRKDSSHLKPPMGFDWYARMTDVDLGAIVAYLRTVPAKE